MGFLTLTLIIVAATAGIVAVITMVNDRARREVLGRASGGLFEDGARSVLITPADPSGLRQWLFSFLPSGEDASVTRERLVHAGYSAADAVPLYSAARLVVLASLTLLAVLLAPTHSFVQWVLIVLIAATAGALAPVYWLTRQVRVRRDGLLRSMPDAMDLLVLCVEAGLGFDAAILHVARDMKGVHPDLSRELMLINRRVNAGMTREEALRALYTRTGVEELRVLVQNLIQADKLGTSVAKMLRVYADTLRRKRRQRAERRAATAALRMTFPLAGLILPALFVVILGPALMRIYGLFAQK
jgi:tight adherence protein C